MVQQLDIFVHSVENSRENERHLNANKDRFNRQCKQVLEILQRGTKLTTKTALLYYGIGDLRRRCKDLRDNGIEIQWEWETDENGKTTRYKKWFMNANN